MKDTHKVKKSIAEVAESHEKHYGSYYVTIPYIEGDNIKHVHVLTETGKEVFDKLIQATRNLEVDV